MRPAFQVANLISKIWAEKGDRARLQIHPMSAGRLGRGASQMKLAVPMARVWIGPAKVNLSHATFCSFSRVIHNHVGDEYPQGSPPHPARHGSHPDRPGCLQFVYTANPTSPSATWLIEVDMRGVTLNDANEPVDPGVVNMLRERTPNRLQTLGYAPDAVDRLIGGVLPQHQETNLSPRLGLTICNVRSSTPHLTGNKGFLAPWRATTPRVHPYSLAASEEIWTE